MAPVTILARLKSLYTKHQGWSYLFSPAPNTRQLTANTHQTSPRSPCRRSFSSLYVHDPCALSFSLCSVDLQFAKLNLDSRPLTTSSGPPYVHICGPFLSVSGHAPFPQPQPRCPLRDSRAHSRRHGFLYSLFPDCPVDHCRRG